ncbi:hypothetical protein ACO1O0_005911 [Amphichorda felina]
MTDLGLDLDIPRSSDRSWNMVCLSPQLHDWWGKGYWAFKVLSHEDGVEGEKDGFTNVVLQFHWMPIPQKDPGSSPPLPPNSDVVWGEEAELHKRLQRSDLTAHNFVSSRPIRTGDLFHISLKPEDGPKFIRMMDLQWAIINIIALAGAAGDPDLLPLNDDDEGGFEEQAAVGSASESVASWIESIEPGMPPEEGVSGEQNREA